MSYIFQRKLFYYAEEIRFFFALTAYVYRNKPIE